MRSPSCGSRDFASSTPSRSICIRGSTTRRTRSDPTATASSSITPWSRSDGTAGRVRRRSGDASSRIGRKRSKPCPTPISIRSFRGRSGSVAAASGDGSATIAPERRLGSKSPAPRTTNIDELIWRQEPKEWPTAGVPPPHGQGRIAMHRLLCPIVAATGLFAALVSGETWAAGLDPGVVEKAKKEGEVTFYTNLIVNQVVRPLVAAFEQKYGIRVNVSRADSQATVLKLINEARAGRNQVDIWNLSSGLKSLIEAGVIAQFNAPSAAEYPPNYRDAAGRWVATNVYVNTPGYNTNLVPPKDAPKTYEDLLAPKWKGKIAWKPNDVSGATGFIGNILTSRGEEQGMAYLRALARQGITKDAPHPNAALLFIEFMISQEGQKIFQAAEYLPAHPKVPALTPALKPDGGGFKATILSPETIDQGFDRWTQIFNQLFR